MKFIDFKLKDLVGKPVLWTRAGDSSGVVKMLTRISRTLKQGFEVEGGEGKIFNYNNGHQRAEDGRMYTILSMCELVTNEDIIAIRADWDIIKENIRQEKIKKQEQLLTDNLERRQKLVKDIEVLQDKLVVQEEIVNKLTLSQMIINQTDKLPSLTIPQLRRIINELKD